MKKFLAIAAVVLAAGSWAAGAEAYTKPQGVPQITIPDYNVTGAFWADKTPMGEAIAWFELQSNGTWTTCGYCLIRPNPQGLEGDLQAAGGVQLYLAARLPEMNSLLMRRFPSMGTQTAISEINQTLFGHAYRIVNGTPTIYKP